MAKSKSHMPPNFHTVTPYIVVPGIARLLDFLEQAFGAQRREVMKREDGSIAHASVTLGDSILEMGESVDKKSMPMTFHVYIPNVDDDVQTRPRRRSKIPQPTHGPVLRRAQRRPHRRLGQPLVHRHLHRRSDSRRTVRPRRRPRRVIALSATSRNLNRSRLVISTGASRRFFSNARFCERIGLGSGVLAPSRGSAR